MSPLHHWRSVTWPFASLTTLESNYITIILYWEHIIVVSLFYELTLIETYFNILGSKQKKKKKKVAIIHFCRRNLFDYLTPFLCPHYIHYVGVKHNSKSFLSSMLLQIATVSKGIKKWWQQYNITEEFSRNQLEKF